MTTLTLRNRKTLDFLFRQHNGWLNGWLRRQSRTIASPEDIASEVFMRLLTMPNIEDLREPRAMMATLARRVVYELRRRNDLARSYEAELAAIPAGLVISPEDQLIVMEALRAIDEMLATMSVKARTAFLYSQIDGLHYAEIAEKLNVSVSMVGKYVAQGLKLAYTFDPLRP